MIAQPVSELQLTDQVRDRLSHQMGFIESGRSQVVMSPLAENYGAEELMSSFRKEVFNPNESLLTSRLLEIEMANFDKFGPRSIAKPWSERKKSTYGYWEGSAGQELSFDYEDILADIFSVQSRLRYLSWDAVAKSTKSNTSAGLPTLSKKADDREAAVSRMRSGLTFWPAVLFTRTQEGDKTRDVWGMPMETIILEGSAFLPIFPFFQVNPYFSALRGPDAVDEAVDKLMKSAYSRSLTLCSLDFSKYDQSVKRGLTQSAWGFIASLFQDETVVFDIAENFHTVGLVTPDGVLKGEHGVPSGSWFTNLIDSMVQLALDSMVAEDQLIQVQGDDGLVAVSGDTSRLEDHYSKYGLEFNTAKSQVSQEDAVYLQRYYHPDYEVDGRMRGVYPVMRALNRLMFQERFINLDTIGVSGADYFSIRAIMILENCKWHPMFEPLVKWFVSKDAKGLKFSEQGLRNYVHSFSKRSSTDTVNQYSDVVEGIRATETFQLIQRA